MSTATFTPTQAESPSNWQKQYGYSDNDLVEAYLMGKEQGKTEQQRINKNLFDANLLKAQEVAERLFKEIGAYKISMKSAHLKAESLTSFSILFVSDKDDFVKDEFRNALILARSFKKLTDDDTFAISFTFTPDSDTLNEDCLASDGFFIKYYGQK